MPDISMCSNQSCPSRLECYRFVARPNPYRQSFFVGLEPDEKTGKCEHFWQADANDIAHYNAREDRENYWGKDS